MLVLMTDFGAAGPYVGQMKAVLLRRAPGVPVVDLCHDLSPCDPRAAAYFLPAYGGEPFPMGSVFLCVVDPGVGTDRAPVAVKADGRWFVGPDNGLFAPLVRRASRVAAWKLEWTPPACSATFHGRDLFAPVAAALAAGGQPDPWADHTNPLRASPLPAASLDRRDWPNDLPEVIYRDHFGNVMTGLRAATAPVGRTLLAAGKALSFAPTFAAVAPGAAFWTANSNGLVEVCVNGAGADRVLGLKVGDPVVWD